MNLGEFLPHGFKIPLGRSCALGGLPLPSHGVHDCPKLIAKLMIVGALGGAGFGEGFVGGDFDFTAAEDINDGG